MACRLVYSRPGPVGSEPDGMPYAGEVLAAGVANCRRPIWLMSNIERTYWIRMSNPLGQPVPLRSSEQLKVCHSSIFSNPALDISVFFNCNTVM